MPHVIPIHSTIQRAWKIIYAEYKKLERKLGCPPFEFSAPPHSAIHEYVPQDGQEFILNFWDPAHKEVVLAVEIEPISGEKNCNVFIHPQGNAFQEPVKSSVALWKKIEKSLRKENPRRVQKPAHRKKKPKPQPQTLIALEGLREFYFKTLKDRSAIISRKAAANKFGIVTNTWRTHDRALWDHWEDRGYKVQKVQ